MIKNHWDLNVVKSDRALGLKSGLKIRLAEELAVSLIDQGLAWPCGKPDDPPSHLLQRLQGLIDPSILGPKMVEPDQLKAVDEFVFPGGLRRAFVDGSQLKWFKGKTGLREMVGTKLSAAGGAQSDLFMLLRLTALECTDRWHWKSSECTEHVYGEEYSRERPYDPMDPRDRVLMDSGPFYGEWELFAGQALELQADLDDLIEGAIKDGRIIVGQNTKSGDRFVPPEVAHKTDFRSFDGNYDCLLSADLPKVGFLERSLPAKRKLAIEWANAALAHYSEMGRRFSADDAQTVMQERFDLTMHAALKAWKKTNYPKGKLGNISTIQRVTLEELRKFENI